MKMNESLHNDFAHRKSICFKNLVDGRVDYSLVLQKAVVAEYTEKPLCYCNDCITSRLQARGYDYEKNEFKPAGDISHPVECADIVQLMAGIDETTTSMLPPGTVWNSYDHRSLILEEDPTVRTISYTEPKAPTSPWFTLKLPKIFYGVSPQGDAPYVSHVWIQHGQVFSALPLPNIYFANGAVCTHGVSSSRTTKSYHEMIAGAIADFWGAGFNEEVGDFKGSNFVAYLSNHVGTLMQELRERSIDVEVSKLRRTYAGWERNSGAAIVVDFMNSVLWGDSPTLKVLKLWEIHPNTIFKPEYMNYLGCIEPMQMITELEKINTETAQGGENTQRFIAKINSSVAIAKQNHT